MSTLADSIVTSHKEAAKRARTFLATSRSLKLKPTEALELVAQVLGVANWQTLLGMANEGKAPHPSYESGDTVAPLADRASIDAASSALAERESIVRRLIGYYIDSHLLAGHHLFSRAKWRAKGSPHHYWTWVYYCVRDYNSIFPWARDAMPAYQLANAAGIAVRVDKKGHWWLESPNEAFQHAEWFETEAQAWTRAGELVEVECARRVGGDFWVPVDFSEKIEVLERRFYRKPAKRTSKVDRVLKETRLEHRAVADAAGMPVIFDVPEADLPIRYITADKEVFDNADAAYEHQASLVGTYVRAWFEWDEPDQWYFLPEKRKIKYAKRYAGSGSSIYFHHNPDALRKACGE